MIQNNIKDDRYPILLPVLKFGDPLLRKKVKQIEDFTVIPAIVEKMFQTMASENGIGLAANQIGMSINLLIIDTCNCEIEEEGETYTFVNSEILWTEGETVMEEGCLSIPDIRAEIKRPETILLKYQDLDKNYNERHFSGLISRAIQHEIDHLNGKLFIDYLSPTKRMLIAKRLLEISKSGNPSSGIIL